MKQLFLLPAILSAATCHGQPSQAVRLRWLLQPHEVLRYKTIMQEVDTSKRRISFAHPSGVLGLLGSKAEAEAFLQLAQSTKTAGNLPMTTRLTRRGANVVAIEMALDQLPTSAERTPGNTAPAISDAPQQTSGAVQLRGAVYADGGLASFYTKADQRNLIAVFFQLPNKAVRVGDTWPLDVSLISTDQTFRCDTAFKKNQVTLTALKTVGNQRVAVLKYELAEFVAGSQINPMLGLSDGINTTVATTYQATAEFSLDKGRWITYQGVMSSTSSGLITQTSTRKFSLRIP